MAGYKVVRTNDIGTTGKKVSEGTGARRTLYNTGSTTLELVETEGAAYGTGHPIPPGGVFNFDDDGLLTGAIFLASSAAGGACSVIGY
jgi:hypothetical protein